MCAVEVQSTQPSPQGQGCHNQHSPASPACGRKELGATQVMKSHYRYLPTNAVLDLMISHINCMRSRQADRSSNLPVFL